MCYSSLAVPPDLVRELQADAAIAELAAIYTAAGPRRTASDAWSRPRRPYAVRSVGCCGARRTPA